MSLFQTIKSALDRNDADSAFAELQQAADGKLDSIFAANLRMRFYKAGEIDQFYEELFGGVVQSAALVLPVSSANQFEKGLRYQRIANDFSTLNLRVGDCIVIIVH